MENRLRQRWDVFAEWCREVGALLVVFFGMGGILIPGSVPVVAIPVALVTGILLSAVGILAVRKEP